MKKRTEIVLDSPIIFRCAVAHRKVFHAISKRLPNGNVAWIRNGKKEFVSFFNSDNDWIGCRYLR